MKNKHYVWLLLGVIIASLGISGCTDSLGNATDSADQSKSDSGSVNENANSEYVTTTCEICGKKFTQPKDGPGYTICDECLNSPEVQKELEKETEGTP